MANNLQISTKRIAISKANAQTVAVTAVAAFVTVFCLVASHTLWGERGYLSRVTTEKEKANTQLKTNVAAVNDLVASYKDFESRPQNIIGGSATGSGDNDGDNATIILDALPSQYDFPALTSSIEKILDNLHLKASTMTGTDDELNQAGTQASSTPQPVPMPFSFTVTNINYANVQALIDALNRSVRPISIDSLTLTGGADNMTLTVDAHTYYQPGKALKMETKVVK